MAQLEKGDTAKAVATMHTLERVADAEKALDVKRGLYIEMMNIYKRQGNTTEADTYHLKALELSDSLYDFRKGYELKNIESQKEIDDANIRYEHLWQKNDTNKRIALIVSTAALLLLVFAAITYYYKVKGDRLLKSLYQKNQSLLNRLNDISKNDLSTTDNIQTTSTNRKYAASQMSHDIQQEYVKNIIEVMETSDNIYVSGFTIKHLADIAGMHEKKVSQVINEIWHMNFNTWYNTYRCKEAC